jgi:hypothetical protein
MEEIFQIVRDFINDVNFSFVVYKPDKFLQLHFKESQTLHGVVKKASIYNVQKNNTFNLVCNLKHDFFSDSTIEINYLKSGHNINQKVNKHLYTGKNEDTLQLFEKLKSEFYDPYLIIPVLPPR